MGVRATRARQLSTATVLYGFPAQQGTPAARPTRFDMTAALSVTPVSVQSGTSMYVPVSLSRCVPSWVCLLGGIYSSDGDLPSTVVVIVFRVTAVLVLLLILLSRVTIPFLEKTTQPGRRPRGASPRPRAGLPRVVLVVFVCLNL